MTNENRSEAASAMWRRESYRKRYFNTIRTKAGIRVHPRTRTHPCSGCGKNIVDDAQHAPHCAPAPVVKPKLIDPWRGNGRSTGP